jgi:hypothetical protein
MSGITAFTVSGQVYTFRDLWRVSSPGGRHHTEAIWDTTCPDCGRPFEVFTGMVPETRGINRRCQACRKPLVRVGAKA